MSNNSGIEKITNMKTYEFGNPVADIVLVQPVDDYDLKGVENEFAFISSEYKGDIRLVAVKVDDWNRDLSPWKAPAVFGKEGFCGEAEKTMKDIIRICSDSSKTFYIGGYSLAGLFSLWALYNTDVFKGAACASPSMWFPGLLEYMKENKIRGEKIYLSLGNREEKAKNPVMATVGDRIREAYALLSGQGINCVLEWNEGNHFKDADIRTAKAFLWLLNDKKEREKIL